MTYLYCDLLSPEWMAQYKIQPGTNQPVEKKKLKYEDVSKDLSNFRLFRNLVSVVLFNWFVLNPVFSYCMMFLHERRGFAGVR